MDGEDDVGVAVVVEVGRGGAENTGRPVHDLDPGIERAVARPEVKEGALGGVGAADAIEVPVVVEVSQVDAPPVVAVPVLAEDSEAARAVAHVAIQAELLRRDEGVHVAVVIEVPRSHVVDLLPVAVGGME